MLEMQVSLSVIVIVHKKVTRFQDLGLRASCK